MVDARDSWEKTAPAELIPDGQSGILFPVLTRDVTGSNRLQKRTRPWRHGAKVDTTGSEADEYVVEAIFHNDVDEDDLGSDPPLWPDRLNQLVAALKSFDTATLHLPWERNIRVKGATWKRHASSDIREGETVSITFVVDNEDKTDAQAVAGKSLSNAKRLVEEATFDAESLGSLSDTISNLNDLADSVNEAAAAPGDFANDLSNQQRSLEHACGRARDALDLGAQTPAEIVQLAASMVKLLQVQDLAGSSAGARQRRTTRRTYTVARDLYAIAAELGQDPDALLALNSQLDDPAYIPPGTVVIVLA